MKRVLLAGATGYLGRHIALKLQEREIYFRVVARSPQKLASFCITPTELVNAELTDPDSLAGCCDGIDVVISTIGITKQKDGLTYMDVDYQANINLLEEAKRSGVKKFIFISAHNANKLRHLKICEAKERFADELKKSGLDYCIIRPNGFFSDMAEFIKMAKRGRIYLFGNGNFRLNPIHGADLANFCLDAIKRNDKELDVGGPETLSQNKIASLAFEAIAKPKQISYIPEWVRKVSLTLMRLFTSSKTYGPVEFFMTVMAMDMSAPEYGHHKLKSYFESLKNG